MSDRGLPEVITLRDKGRFLQLRWQQGEAVEIDAGLLRAKCRCSGCFKVSGVGRHPPLVAVARPEAGSDIAILELRQIGSTGLQAVFSDGHERGIYPWSYLSAIASSVERGTWQCAG